MAGYATPLRDHLTLTCHLVDRTFLQGFCRVVRAGSGRWLPDSCLSILMAGGLTTRRGARH